MPVRLWMISRSWPPAWKTFSTSSLFDEQVEQRLQVDALGLRIDRRRLLGARDLDQAQVRPIGVLAHELGVHGDEGVGGEAVDESLEVVGLGNQRMNMHESCGAIAAPSRVDKNVSGREARRAISRHNFPLERSRVQSCTPIVPTPAPSCAPATSARPSACRAGSTASATMAHLLFVDLRDHYGITQIVARHGFAGASRRSTGCASNWS